MLGLGLGIGVAQTAPLKRYSIGGKAPAVVADYSSGIYGLNGAPVGFDGLFSFSRLSAGWKLNALGHWVKALAGEPRTGHHIWQGGALVPAGLAVCSEVRTNLLLNSDSLSTQVVTVTAVEHTLSFTGTGTVTLSGAATDGPLIGVGSSEANRVSLSFTPSAGSLTLTVSGDVQTAQLEAGPYVTDYIPTQATQVSTAAESLQNDPVRLARAVGVFGPELNPDPTFATQWDTANEGISVSDGKIVFDHVALVDRTFYVRIPPTTDQFILLEVDVDELDGSLNALYGGLPSIITAPGKCAFLVGPTSGASTVGIFAQTEGTTAVISRFSAREVTMPEVLTFLMNGTVTYEDEDSFNTAKLIEWRVSSDDYLEISLDTSGAETGEMNFKSNLGGVLMGAQSAPDAYAPGTEVPFSIALIVTATDIEGLYNGVSTGQVAHGGMADLLSAPMQIFPVGNATLKDLRLWSEALPAADLSQTT